MTEWNPDLLAGQRLLVNGRPDLAEAYLRKGLAAAPEHVLGHAHLSECLTARKAFNEARTEAKTSISLAPDSPVGHAVLGEVESAAGHWRQAEAAMKEAARLDPTQLRHRAVLGYALLQQGRPGRALTVAQESLRLQPNDIGALNLRALALADLGRVAEARETIRSALISEPESATLHSNLAFVLIGLGDPASAREESLEALRLDPKLEIAQRNLRASERASGRPPSVVWSRASTWWARRPVWERTIFVVGLSMVAPIAPVAGVIAFMVAAWWANLVIARKLSSPGLVSRPWARIGSLFAAVAQISSVFVVPLVASRYISSMSGIGAMVAGFALAGAAAARRPYRQVAFGIALIAVAAGTVSTTFGTGGFGGQARPTPSYAGALLSDADIEYCLFGGSSDVDTQAAAVGINLNSIRWAILGAQPMPDVPADSSDADFAAFQAWFDAAIESAHRNAAFVEGCAAGIDRLPSSSP